MSVVNTNRPGADVEREAGLLNLLEDDDDHDIQDSVVGDCSELGRGTSRARTAPPTLAFNPFEKAAAEKSDAAAAQADGARPQSNTDWNLGGAKFTMPVDPAAQPAAHAAGVNGLDTLAQQFANTSLSAAFNGAPLPGVNAPAATTATPEPSSNGMNGMPNMNGINDVKVPNDMLSNNAAGLGMMNMMSMNAMAMGMGGMGMGMGMPMGMGFGTMGGMMGANGYGLGMMGGMGMAPGTMSEDDEAAWSKLGMGWNDAMFQQQQRAMQDPAAAAALQNGMQGRNGGGNGSMLHHAMPGAMPHQGAQQGGTRIQATAPGRFGQAPSPAPHVGGIHPQKAEPFGMGDEKRSGGGNSPKAGGVAKKGGRGGGGVPAAGGGGVQGGGVQAAQQNPHPSPLLEEFRRKHRSWELPDFVGCVAEFSRDQDGSRLIQKKLEQTSQQGETGRKHLAGVFEELQPQALALMTDVFGNYVIQKLLEHGSDEHRRLLCAAMRGSVVDLTMQTYGCRVVQKALDLVPLPQQTQLISELHGRVPECVKDTNGNHVVQKCIEVVPDHCEYIIQAFLTNIDTLATHPYGCRVIQKILEYGKRNPNSVLAKASAPVIETIVAKSRNLVMNQNGNYVVQHVMSNAPSFSPGIVLRVCDDFGMLSCHKFASNVAEKVYLCADPVVRERIVNSVCTTAPGQAESPLQVMMRDQYGNYVVQKMLDVNDMCSQILVRSIKPQAVMLQRTNYGKHILAKVERLESGGFRMGGRGANRS